MSNSIRKYLSKKITQAVLDFNLLTEVDKVLIAVSGGKDSTALLLELISRIGKIDPAYILEAIHIQSDFASFEARDFLKELSLTLPIPFHFLNVPIKENLKEHAKLNCYFCSNRRRIELLNFAQKHGFNKIALGHHIDEIIETMLMNMLYNAKFSAMPPKVCYKKYPVEIIRPLTYCEEKEIIKYIKHLNLAQYTCTCNFSANSNRKHIRKIILELTGGNYTLKRNLFESMRNICTDYLLP